MPDFTEEVYIDPKTDFGFKHLFGKEDNKEFLISFLNALLRGKHVVKSLEYMPTENVAHLPEMRNSVFDVYCKGENGEHFIVEMQNAYQPTFKARSVYYATSPIQEGVKKGAKHYGFPPVYTIGLLNFTIDRDHWGKDSYLTEVKLMDVDEKTVFFDDLTFIYVEIPKFAKEVYELDNDLDRWVFLLQNLSRLLSKPAELQARVFERFFRQAQIKKLTMEEAKKYRMDSMSKVSFYEMLDYAENEGLEKGIMKAKEEMAKSLLKKGMEPSLISEVTGLDCEAVKRLCD